MTESLGRWYMDNDESDQRLPHKDESANQVTMEHLAKLGVQYYKLDPANYAEPLTKLRNEFGFDYDDTIECSPKTLPNYDNMLETFYTEHLHADDEIRFILAGSGYFDVRDVDNYIKAMRLFCGVPVWTPENRPADAHPARQSYLRRDIGTALAAN